MFGAQTLKFRFVAPTLLFLLVAHSAWAEPPKTDSNQSSTIDADSELKAKITIKVNELRRRMVNKYLGHEDYIMSPLLNEPIRQEIDFFMKPLFDLVSREEITQDLNFLQVGGITGGGKSAMLKDFIKWREELGLLRKNRKGIQNGTATKEMNLTIVDEYGKDLKEIEAINGPKLSFTKRFELFLDTSAVIGFDEASHFARPSKDLEKDLNRDLDHLKETWIAVQEKRLKPRGKEKPVQRDESEFGGNYEAYRDHLREYATAVNDWQAALALGEAKDAEGLKRTYEELATKRREKYETDRRARDKINNFTKKLWSALSGGTFEEGEEQQMAESHKKEIEDTFQRLAKFKAKYEHDPLLKEAAELQQKIKEAETKLSASDAEIKSLLKKAETLKETLEDFEDASPRQIELWAETHGKKDEIRRLRNGSPTLPDFFEQMMKDLTSDPSHSRRGTVGYVEAKEASLNASINAFRKMAADALTGHITKLDHDLADLEPRIVREKKAVQDSVETKKAWGKKEQQVHRDEMKQTEALLAELIKLEKDYERSIDDALETTAAIHAVQDFVNNELDAGKLAEFSKDFAQRLERFKNNPEDWIQHLKNSKDSKIQFAQMLAMNPTAAREIVRKAVTNFSVTTNGKFFGNMLVVWTTNVLKLEQEIKQRVANVLASGRKVGWNEYADWYDELLRRPEFASWPAEMFSEHFPDLFRPLISETAAHGPQGSTRRRLEGARGPVFIGPARAPLLLNHATTTMKNLYEDWKSKKISEGVKFSGDLFIHENVPALFVREGDSAELGPNVVIEHVRQVMGDLLTQLNLYVDTERAKNPSTPIMMNIGIINEKLDGDNNVLKLRTMHPEYTQEGGKILRGAATAENWGKYTSKKVIGPGYLHHFRPSKDLQAEAEYPDKRSYVWAAENPSLYAAEAVPATLKELDEQRKADAKAKVDKAELEKKLAFESTQGERNLLAAKATEARATQLDQFHEFVKKLPAGDPTSDFAEFYRNVDPQMRDSIRDEIMEAVNRATPRKGYNLGMLYLWLKNDYEAKKNLDEYVVNLFPSLQKIGRRNMLMLFASLVRNPAKYDDLYESLRPGVLTNLVRWGGCSTPLRRILDRDIPLSARKGVEWHPVRASDLIPKIGIGGK